MTNLNNIIREVSLCANIDWQGSVTYDILFFLRDKQFWVLEIALENGDEYVEYKDEN